MPASTASSTRPEIDAFLNGKPRCGAFPSAPKPASLRLDRKEALGYLGYGKQELESGLARRFEDIAGEVEGTLSPAFSWAAFPVARAAASGADAGVELAGARVRLMGVSMAEHLEGARGAALLSCTLGMESERAITRYQATSPTDALFYNACAAALVEACANAVEADIVRAAADARLHTNWRFSPGYGDAPLSLQPAILRALGAPGRLAVSCTDSFLLVPSKSITAVVGLFEEGVHADGVRRGCATCSLSHVCAIRKQGRTCHG